MIARPPIIWHGSWYKHFTRRHLRCYQPPALLPQAPAGPDDLACDDTMPIPAAAIAPVPPAPAGHAWHNNGNGHPTATGNDQPRRSRAARPWDGIGGQS